MTVVTEWSALSSDELSEYAAHFWAGGCVCACDDIQEQKPDQYVWTFDRDFDLSRLININIDWSSWWLEEKTDRDAEGLSCGQGLEDWWASGVDERLEEPLVLVLDRSGKAHIWDGSHRVGISYAHALRYVPAILGVLV